MQTKILVGLEAAQVNALNEIMHSEHLSRSQLIRQAVEDFLAKKKISMAKKEHKLLKYAGILKNIDGLEFQKKLRTEWDK